ncbi:MAG: hypothetical protein KAH01_04185 [Caldisericia bacterium]|nr:hypothetical protein [Caldisericia bacterium]
MKLKKFVCSNCGGKTEFDVKSQELKCPNCGTVYGILKEEASSKHLISEYSANVDAIEKQEASVLECSSCGATIELETTVVSGKCPYCDSPVVMTEKAVASIPPDGICPFKIDKHEAVSRFRKWIKGKWLAPNSLKNMYQSGKILGVYLPYWVFDADASCRYTASGGKDRKVEYRENGETKTRTETDWYPVSGNIFHSFKDKIIRATKSINERLLKILGGFNVNNAYKFHHDFFAGFSSEIFNIPMQTTYEEAKQYFQNELHYMVEAKVRRSYDRVRNITMWIKWSNEYYRFMFLPVYTMAYFFNGKTYQILINGDSGQIVGDYPKSVWKIILIIFAVLIIAGLIWYFTQ